MLLLFQVWWPLSLCHCLQFLKHGTVIECVVKNQIYSREKKSCHKISTIIHVYNSGYKDLTEAVIYTY